MKSKFVRLMIVLSVLIVVFSLTTLSSTAQNNEDVIALIRADYPPVDGSTSARPLQKVIASTIHGLPWYWVPEGYQDHYSVMAVLTPEELRDADKRYWANVINRLYHYGTHESYMGLIYEGVDFILVARQPSSDELATAKEADVELDVRPVALDAFVFLLNTTNPIDSLTLQEIKDIYTGVTTNWTELGVTEVIEDIPNNFTDFPREPVNLIHAYTRNPNSGSQELMEALVMRGTPMVENQDMMQSNMGAPIIAISYDSRGIGYSVFFYVSYIHIAYGVKLIGVEGVLPTSATIADGSYPLVTEVYAVVRADMPADSPAVLLRDWLLTPEGQATIASSGYVPLPKS